MKYFNPKYLQKPVKVKTDFTSTSKGLATQHYTTQGAQKTRPESKEQKAPPQTKPKPQAQEAPVLTSRKEPGGTAQLKKADNKGQPKTEPRQLVNDEKQTKKAEIVKLLQTPEQGAKNDIKSNQLLQPPSAKDQKRVLLPESLPETEVKKKRQGNPQNFEKSSQEVQGKFPKSKEEIPAQPQLQGKSGQNLTLEEMKQLKLEELRKKPQTQLTPQEREMLRLLGKKK